LALYITGLILPNSKIIGLECLSFYECFNFSEETLGYIFIFLLTIGIINLVFNCQNFKDFLYKLGLLLLALFNLGFFAMMFSII
jgi:hypothetical protein